MSNPDTYQPTRAIPTQVAHPWRASIRTGFAVAVAVILVSVAIWALASGLNIQTSLEAATTAIVLVAGAVTRIMASPVIDAALSQLLNFGAAPQE